jgi:DNA-binding response OmpR family regulator
VDAAIVGGTHRRGALRLAAEERPDLAVLDVTMPGASGYDVTRKLREQDATKEIAVILLTARVHEADVMRGFDSGADDYLKKPFSVKELNGKVRALLGR